ncbi:hypothetical protein IAU60_005485 [Kwoniella sp. DSM 27419]
MSLRPQVYTSNVPPPYLARPIQGSSSQAEDKHRAQLAAYKRDPIRAASASRHAHVAATWAARRGCPPIEEGYEEDNGKKKRSSVIRTVLGSKGSPRRRRIRYLLYALVALLCLIGLRPLLGGQGDLARSGHPADPLHPTAARILRKPLGRGRSGSQSSRPQNKQQPRPPLPPALYAKRSASNQHHVKDGLLHVNPDSTVHPIYQLIHDARQEWDEKVARQSKTLKEAVDEYKRRYRRNPPRGFDKWWDYVCANNIPLPDEYDQIHKDLLPFRALSPRDLHQRIKLAATYPDTYVLRVKRGSIRTNAMYSNDIIHGADDRLAQQAEMLKPVARWLPDLEVVWSVHDTPRGIVGWHHRSELVDHVEEDEWLDADDEIDLTLKGWSAACPPRSPIQTFDEFSPKNSIVTPHSLPNTSLSRKTFISSHSASMDICQHPGLIPIHGFLAGKEPHVEALTPIFTLSKTHLHSDILGVPVEQWVEDIREVPWEEKSQDRLLWRGSNTGTHHTVNTPWRESHRTRLLKMTNHLPGTTYPGFVSDDGEVDPGAEVEVETLHPPRGTKGAKVSDGVSRWPLGDMNEWFMDLAFTGVPIQCEIDDGTCDNLAQEYIWVDQMTHDEALDYKYVIDVDGNAWSARFKRLLTSGSLIFKATIAPEWWTDRIQPWVHYVPIQMDYSDLYDALVFFQGDLYGANGEPLLAKDIAQAGREWSNTHWRQVDMTAYMFRLYLEWGRLVAPHRGSMDYRYEEPVAVVLDEREGMYDGDDEVEEGVYDGDGVVELVVEDGEEDEDDDADYE